LKIVEANIAFLSYPFVNFGLKVAEGKIGWPLGDKNRQFRETYLPFGDCNFQIINYLLQLPNI